MIVRISNREHFFSIDNNGHGSKPGQTLLVTLLEKGQETDSKFEQQHFLRWSLQLLRRILGPDPARVGSVRDRFWNRLWNWFREIFPRFLERPKSGRQENSEKVFRRFGCLDRYQAIPHPATGDSIFFYVVLACHKPVLDMNLGLLGEQQVCYLCAIQTISYGSAYSSWYNQEIFCIDCKVDSGCNPVKVGGTKL